MNLLAEQINIIEGVDPQYQALRGLTIQGLVGGLITLILVVAAIVFFFMLLIGGLRWILSSGDKGQTENARNQITAALVGLIIVFGAFAIATLVEALFGINVFELTLPNFIDGTGGN